MTFEELQDAVMDALNLTSTEARTRVKRSLNQRYREVQSNLNLARTRRGLRDLATVSGNSSVTVSGTAKVFGLYDGVVNHRLLNEISRAEILRLEASDSSLGVPRDYAIFEHLNDVVVLRFFPRPDRVLTLDSDVLLAGTDMTDDDDEPTFPVDFHDVLVHGAKADEYEKMQKNEERSAAEKKYEKRLAELRFFLIKANYLNQTPAARTSRPWPQSGVRVS